MTTIVEVEASPALILEFETGESRVVELGPMVWASGSGKMHRAELSGLAITIPASEHQLRVVTSATALNSDGYEVSVLVKHSAGDNSVTVESNIDLTGISLLLSGA